MHALIISAIIQTYMHEYIKFSFNTKFIIFLLKQFDMILFDIKQTII